MSSRRPSVSAGDLHFTPGVSEELSKVKRPKCLENTRLADAVSQGYRGTALREEGQNKDISRGRLIQPTKMKVRCRLD